MSPNLNAYAERFGRSIKDECLHRIIFIGQESLRRAIADYIQHYLTERNHQVLENQLFRPEPSCGVSRGGHLSASLSGRNAQLLLPRRGVRTSAEILDITG